LILLCVITIGAVGIEVKTENLVNNLVDKMEEKRIYVPSDPIPIPYKK